MTRKKAQTKPNTELPVRTINDLMENLDNEIAAIKSGELSELRGRLVAKSRDMQLKSFELILTAARIEARYRPEMAKRLGLPALGEPKTIGASGVQ